jgi:hypothetical protein
LDFWLVWFSESDEECFGADLVDFGYVGACGLFVDFVCGYGYIEACHYFLQLFSLRRTGKRVSSFGKLVSVSVLLFCFVLWHKKGAVT